jgi:predicted lysophospholipase L1 biosynthesis ABC-type transport system permease subunit
VVGAVKLESLTSAADHGAIYYPYQYLRVRAFHLVVRTRSGADAIAPVLGRLLRRLDPELPLTDVRSMDARVSDSLQPRRAPAVAAGLFAGAALLLALIGLYGVMAYAVAARTSEFGIRLALGAMRADLLRLVLRQGAGLVAVGLAVGVTLSAASAAAVRPLLYDVSPFDPLALGAVTAALASVATLACLVPALRAARVTPLTALRHD